MSPRGVLVPVVVLPGRRPRSAGAGRAQESGRLCFCAVALGDWGARRKVNTVSRLPSDWGSSGVLQYCHVPAGGSGKPFLVALASTVISRRSQRHGQSVAPLAASRDTGGIVFRGRGELNADLQKSITKQAASKISGKTGVVMAKGPAEDGSVGFAPGWRAPERIQEWKDVPWAHLLPWQELTQGHASSADAA